MKIPMLIILLMLFVMFVPTVTFGEDYYGSKDHSDTTEFAEDTGKLFGWVAVVLTVVPVALYPARKILPSVMRKREALQKKSVSLLHFLKTLHEPIGIMVFLLAALHGLLLVWSEGEFGTVEWIGTIALFLAVIGGMFGASLLKKSKVKVLHYTHTLLLLAAIIIGGIHILLA